MLYHKDIKMNNDLFNDNSLLNASKRAKVLVLEQDPDAIGMDLQKSSKKIESNISSYNNYQSNFCSRFASRRAQHRKYIFGTTTTTTTTTTKQEPNTTTSTTITTTTTAQPPPKSTKTALSSSTSSTSSTPSSTTTNKLNNDDNTYTFSTQRSQEQVDAAPASSKWYSLVNVNSSGKFFEKVRKFCSHLDLLPMDNWQLQHDELNKLPDWIYCQTKKDILRFCRKPIPGMTSPQMYIKVPGVWTAAHEENNQFRSVNVNHGPGPCEWAGVAAEHVPRLRRLVLQSHSIDIYKEEGKLKNEQIEILVGHKML